MFGIEGQPDLEMISHKIRIFYIYYFYQRLCRVALHWRWTAHSEFAVTQGAICMRVTSILRTQNFACNKHFNRKLRTQLKQPKIYMTFNFSQGLSINIKHGPPQSLESVHAENKQCSGSGRIRNYLASWIRIQIRCWMVPVFKIRIRKF